ncbi:MAG: hypothetical protein IPI44_01380 [Sulfuritalea sp.]|nr:hypothetical protein [Sulfuritalea sp.]
MTHGNATKLQTATIMGTVGNDTLNDWTAWRNDPWSGVDIPGGKGGTDTLLGGEGNDQLRGGTGDDILDGA